MRSRAEGIGQESRRLWAREQEVVDRRAGGGGQEVVGRRAGGDGQESRRWWAGEQEEGRRAGGDVVSDTRSQWRKETTRPSPDQQHRTTETPE